MQMGRTGRSDQPARNGVHAHSAHPVLLDCCKGGLIRQFLTTNGRCMAHHGNELCDITGPNRAQANQSHNATRCPTRLGAPHVSALICALHKNAWSETLGAHVCSLNAVECVWMNGMLVLAQLRMPWQSIRESGSPMECTVALSEKFGG